MIKVDEKGIEISGNIREILNDLSNISEALKENGISEKLIKYAINLGLTEDDKKGKYTEEAAKKKWQ